MPEGEDQLPTPLSSRARLQCWREPSLPVILPSIHPHPRIHLLQDNFPFKGRPRLTHWIIGARISAPPSPDLQFPSDLSCAVVLANDLDPSGARRASLAPPSQWW